MTEKIGLIKNPLTIIAIFAGLAEVSGTIVLPFIAESNQRLFIFFLIVFPSILILSFFITLNFNNKVLYAPSDYKDEANYIKINKYDFSKQEIIEFKVPKQETIQETTQETLVKRLDQIKIYQSQLKNREILEKYRAEIKASKEKDISTIPLITTPTTSKYIETSGYDLLISNFVNVDQFIWHMKELDVDFKVYQPDFDFETKNYSNHRAIWLGSSIRLELAKFLIGESKKYYPHLRYIKVMDEAGYPSEDKQLYIGGSTETAVERMGRIPLQDADFEKLNSFTDLTSFHKFINEFGE